MGRIEEMPHTEAAIVVEASTSLISPGSTLPQEEKLKLAHKLLTEVLEQGSSQPRDDSELIALREQVKKLSSEKAAL